MRLNGDMPLDGRSAGLEVVGIWFHLSGEMVSCMTATRFATKVVHFRGSLAIHWSTIVESDQAKTS